MNFSNKLKLRALKTTRMQRLETFAFALEKKLTTKTTHRMDVLEIIKDQIISVKEKTDTFIKNVDLEKWNISPEILETNMNWQIGHIILANYLHGIASISGVNEKVNERINMQNFKKFYGPNSTPNMFVDEKPKNEELLKLYEFIFELIRLEISSCWQRRLTMT